MAERRIINGYIVERGDDGVIRTIGTADQGPPADPTFQYKGAQAAADLTGKNVTTQGNAIDNQIAAATQGSQISKAGSDAVTAARNSQTAGLPEGFMWGADGKTAIPIPGYTRQGLSPEIRKGAIDAFKDADELDRVAAELRNQYNQDIGKTKGIAGLRDLLPTPGHRVFNDTANQARGFIKRSLGFTGGESNTLAETAATYGPFLPQASDSDAQIENKIRAIQNLANQARSKASGILGGTPDAQGRVIPGQEPGSVWQQTYGTAPTNGPAAPFGAREQAKPIPREMQAELDAYIQQNGRATTEEGLKSFIGGLYAKYGGEPGPGIDEYARATAGALQNGGQINTNIPPQTVPLERGSLDSYRNNLIAHPFGTAAANFADATAIGIPSILAGDRIQAANEQNPNSALLGQVAGSILGTEGLSAIGRNTIGRAVPAALGGGGLASLARGVGTDAAYSAGYGAAQGNDPLASAAFGAGGSLLGRGIGKVAGDVAGGLDSPTIARLRALGVTPTIGQIARGRAVDQGGRSALAGIEDVIANTQGAGSLVNSARNRALEDANLGVFNTASGGRPITGIGVEGLDQLSGASNAAYGDALNGVNLSPDAQFVTDRAAAQARGAQIDAARGRGDYGLIDSQQLNPILGAGPDISGSQMQDALRLLSGQSRAYRKAAGGAAPDPSAEMVSSALDQTGDAFTDLAGRQSPGTLPKLREANSVYRNLNILDDAAERALNDGGVFTGAQLGQAIKKNTGMFGRRGLRSASDSPLYQIQQDMQAVLPNKVPMTGVNTAPALALGGAAASAAGYGTDNDWLKAGGLAALLATPYTKAGQSAAARALLDRPATLKALGEIIRANSGRFGSAAIPLALPLAQ